MRKYRRKKGTTQNRGVFYSKPYVENLEKRLELSERQKEAFQRRCVELEEREQNIINVLHSTNMPKKTNVRALYAKWLRITIERILK